MGAFLDQLCANGDDFELVTELYNGHLWTTDRLLSNATCWLLP